MNTRLRRALFVLVAGVTLLGAITPAFADEGGDPATESAPADSAAPSSGEPEAADASAAPAEAEPDPAVGQAVPEATEAEEPSDEPAADEGDEPEAPGDEATEQHEASQAAVESDGSAPSVSASRVNPGTATTGAGQTVNIVINSPSPGDDIQPGDTVTVTGQASIGLLGANVNIAYVIDVSGSTSAIVPDCTGDGVDNTVLECEQAAANALNDQLAQIPGVNAGVVPFASGASVAQGLVPASDPAVGAAINALASGGGTNFSNALGAMNDLFSTAPPGEQNIAYFLSDGSGSLDPGPGSALQAAVDAGTQVNTFSIGAGAEGCDPGSNLLAIADATGGVCIVVGDVSEILKVIQDLKPAGIDKVEISVNGGPPVEADLDLLGNFSVQVTGFVFGENSIVATAFTDDGTEAAADVTIDIDEPQAEVLGAVLVAAGPAAGSSDDTLPVTGSQTMTLAAVGVGLLLAGLALVAAGNRREVPYLAQFHD